MSDDSAILASLIGKLVPTRFPGMSDRMTAIVAYILGQRWIEPAIAEMSVTSDGGVLARHDGDVSASVFIGHRLDLEGTSLPPCQLACHALPG